MEPSFLQLKYNVGSWEPQTQFPCYTKKNEAAFKLLNHIFTD